MNTKQLIIEKSLELVIKEGIESTSLQDIIEAAGISKKTFYKYFSSKDECIAEIINQGYDKVRLEISDILVGQDSKDLLYFRKQLEVYLTQTQNYHLYELTKIIRTGTNIELRKNVFKQEQKDIHWMAKRLTDIYGEEASPYSMEVMTYFYGMLQSVLVTYKIKNISLPVSKIIERNLRYAALILEEMQTSDITLFSHNRTVKEEIIHEIYLLKATGTKEDLVLLEALLDELDQTEKRPTIINAFINSLSFDTADLKKNMVVFLKES